MLTLCLSLGPPTLCTPPPVVPGSSLGSARPSACPSPAQAHHSRAPGSACPGEHGQAQRVQWAVMAARISDRSPSPRPRSPSGGAGLSPGSGPAITRPQRWWMDREVLLVTPTPSLQPQPNRQTVPRQGPGPLPPRVRRRVKLQGQRTSRLPLRQGQLALAKSPRRPLGSIGHFCRLRRDHLAPPGRPSASRGTGARAPPSGEDG